MIQAYMRPDGRVVAESLPNVGDKLQLEGWGEVEIISLSHSTVDNYIQLQVPAGSGVHTWQATFTCKM